MKNVPYAALNYLGRTNSLWTLAVVFLLLCCLPAKGQLRPKRALTAADYPLWHYLEAEEISDDGNWISYKKTYESADSLFVQHRKTGRVYRFAGGSKGEFVAGHHFICRTAGGLVHLLSLENGLEQLLGNVKDFEVFGSYIVTISDQKQGSTLMVYDLEGRLLCNQNNISEYALSADKKKIAFCMSDNQQHFVRILNVGSALQQLVAEADGGPFQRLTWSADSEGLAFMQYRSKESKLYYYETDNKALRTFSTADTAVFPETMNMDPKRKLTISPDHKKVFFRIGQRPELNVKLNKNEVQVWNAQDKFIYPNKSIIENWNIISKHAFWEPDTGRFLQFTDTRLPHGGETGDLNYALTFNPQDYEPQSRSDGDRDIYITDLNTGRQKLLLKKHVSSSGNLLASPGGKYISYFRQGNWFVYDVRKEMHTQINQNIPYSLTLPNDIDPVDSYGNPGWTAGEQYLLLYDQYDIWKVSSDGSRAERLTKGREKGIVFRIVPQTPAQLARADGYTQTAGVFELTEGLVLKARSTNYQYNGIFTWDPRKGVSEICYTDKKISTILKSKNNIYAWMEEDTDLPWHIVVKEPGAKETTLLQSNPQQENFMWTKRETVSYVNQKGETLSGLLYYPAYYEKGKKYPLIVHVYEKQSSQLHQYYLPSLYNTDGFNVANLTAKGYFVLLPDITYETGNVGRSAVDCVEVAVKQVIEKYDVDQKKIGLIGHSFGGFEVDFIITQSKLFACAVAGAAFTNLLSSYLAVSPNYNIPNFFKMEYGQARMKVSPYDDMQGYLKNSPVIHADKVTTPLLSWTGLQDPQVLPSQSFEFYMALRRLGKKYILLAYPGEGHDINAKENAIDLTRRIEAWFDYYLKGEQVPLWLQ